MNAYDIWFGIFLIYHQHYSNLLKIRGSPPVMGINSFWSLFAIYPFQKSLGILWHMDSKESHKV
jgi:hypothetical protein